ncbi:MAG TPA: hypothetical protein VL614_28535 [Acetobacteraceae bacterium]|jgi:phospholipase C|nr:hypothetical protein [Acetobacteraceae bacterium]
MAVDIRHVVVPMLENRSCDCMPGWLYPQNEGFDGSDDSETNNWHRSYGTQQEFQAWVDPSLTAWAVMAAATIPAAARPPARRAAPGRVRPQLFRVPASIVSP